MPTEVFPNWMWISTNLVVKDSLKAVFKGKAVVIPHLKYKLRKYQWKYLIENLTILISRLYLNKDNYSCPGRSQCKEKLNIHSYI